MIPNFQGKIVFQSRENPEDRVEIEWIDEHKEKNKIKYALTYVPKGYRLMSAEGSGKVAEWFKKEIARREQQGNKYKPSMFNQAEFRLILARL